MEHNKQESMKISAVRLYENGFMTQPFAFGGEGMEGIDPAVKYRSLSLKTLLPQGRLWML